MCYTRCTTKLLVQLDVLCIVAAKQQECTSIYYVIIGGRFAPPYKYMAKYVKLMCCQKCPRYYVSQGVPRVQVLKISKEEPWDTLIPRILLQPHE